MSKSCVASLMLLVLGGCGTDTESNLAAELGWRFDYSDYTSNEPADIRACDNGELAEVEAVRLVAVDPDGQVQGFDSRYSCAEGIDQRVPIRGVSDGRFDLTAEAFASDIVLYRLEVPGFEFGGGASEILTLRAAVGELSFRPLLDGSFECDPAVERFTVELFAVEGGVVADAFTIQRVIDEPCAGSFFDQIRVTEIPVRPTDGPQGFVLPRYRVEVIAEGPSGTLGCASFERAIPPGEAAAVGGDENLSLAQCP